MNQFEQQLLASAFLAESPSLPATGTLRALTRVATGFALLAGTCLLAIAGADRIESASLSESDAIVTLEPSAEYLRAVAVSEAADLEDAHQPEASAR